MLPPLLAALDELGLEECVDGALLDVLKLRQLLWTKGRQGALRLRELMPLFCAIFVMPGAKPGEQGGGRDKGRGFSCSWMRSRGPRRARGCS